MTIHKIWDFFLLAFATVMLGGVVLKAVVWMVREAVDEWKSKE